MKSDRSLLIWSFIGGNIVALGSGTPYLFSYFAPQLLSRCQIPISESSNISLSLNVGSTVLGILAGIVADFNPKLSCFIGSLCTACAYGILYLCYEYAISKVYLIILALILVGFGSVSGFYASIKVCTSNFPNHRGVAGACPVSLYGLSSLFLSTICRFLFKGEMNKVFLFLLISCSLMILVGVFTMELKYSSLIKGKYDWTAIDSDEDLNGLELNDAIEVQSTLGSSITDDAEVNTYAYGSSQMTEHSNHSREVSRPSLSPRGQQSFRDYSIVSPNSVGRQLSALKSQYASESPAIEGLLQRTDSTSLPVKPTKNSYEQDVDLPILQTVATRTFLLYYVIVAILQGIGQSYIYSVGFIIQTQINSVSNENIKLDPISIQASQVAIISLFSFMGRISSGVISDILAKKFNAQRLWMIFVASLIALWASLKITQNSGSANKFDSISNIYTASALYGYAFGAFFGSFPSVVADAFGTKGLSTLWGLCTTGGLFTVKIFTRLLANNIAQQTDPKTNTCNVGAECYRKSFNVVALSSIFAGFLLLVAIGIAHYKNKTKYSH